MRRTDRRCGGLKRRRNFHAVALKSFFVFGFFWVLIVPITAVPWKKQFSLGTCPIFNEKTAVYSTYDDIIQSTCRNENGIQAAFDMTLERLPVRKDEVCYLGGAPTRLLPRKADGKSGAFGFQVLPDQLVSEMQYAPLSTAPKGPLDSPASGCDPRTWTLDVHFYRVNNSLPLYEMLGFDPREICFFKRHPFRAVIEIRGLGPNVGVVRTVEVVFEMFSGRYKNFFNRPYTIRATHTHTVIPIRLQNINKAEELLSYAQNHVTLRFVKMDLSVSATTPRSVSRKKQDKARTSGSFDESEVAIRSPIDHSNDLDEDSSDFGDLLPQDDRNRNSSEESNNGEQHPELPKEVSLEALGLKTFFRVCCNKISPLQPQTFRSRKVSINVFGPLQS